jgi:hypothetical protein
MSLYLVGGLVLLGLAGCGRGFFEERAPWRHEAEEACLKSGVIKESAAVAMLRPINGPGMCGADFPLKVAALGRDENVAMSYADELRPPGAIPNVTSYPRPAQSYDPAPYTPTPYTPPPYGQPPAQDGGQPYAYPRADQNAPLSLSPPGVRQSGSEDDEVAQDRRYAQPSYGVSRGPYRTGPQTDPAAEDFQPSRNGRDLSSTSNGYPPSGPAMEAPQALAYAGPATVSPAATLACPIVSALDRWISEAVQPAALKWFGQPVVEIRQISAYSCRGMNGQPGAHISEHAFGNALDVAAFTLADGRKITVKGGWRGLPEEQGFLRDVEGAACERFTTVLAPGSNAYHYDHIHVDLMRRASGRRICQPAAISGEVAAARARSRYAGGRDITGTIRGGRTPNAPMSYAETDDDHESFGRPRE